MSSDQDNGRPRPPSIALFVDAENLINTAMDVGLPVDLAPIIEKLLEIGRITVRRAFGDLDAACKNDWKLRNQIRRMFQESLCSFEDIPYMTKHKNTADMALTVNALSTGFTHPDITHFAIVASDRDYAPLTSKLRELGKTVIGIGTSPDTTNQLYVRSCDIFLYYSTMFEDDASQETPSRQGDPSIMDDYIKLLCQAADVVVRRGGRPFGAKIVPILRQMRPDFDPRLAGAGSFRDVAAAAEKAGVVRIEAHGSDILIFPTSDSGRILETAREDRLIGVGDEGKAKAMYLGFLESKLKCPLPRIADRKLIFENAADRLDERLRTQGAVELFELSHDVEELARADGRQAEPVFKLLYSIFRAGVFKHESSDQPFNPIIKGIEDIPAIEWDNVFIWNCIEVIRKERRRWSILEKPLAEIFEVGVEDIRRLTKDPAD
ncbi:MAG: NYN domain-containing protein [Chitinivibrionia bacterium]|nr:NYN domain-containing protein [Chitinivibrionia bacterium]